MATEEKPLDDFRDISIYPTECDLEGVAQIRHNKKKGGSLLLRIMAIMSLYVKATITIYTMYYHISLLCNT